MRKLYLNVDMAFGSMINAQNEAMQNAAANANGAVNGFMGMGLAGGQGMNAQGFFQAKMAQQVSQPQAKPATTNDTTWICPTCGNQCNGKFYQKMERQNQRHVSVQIAENKSLQMLRILSKLRSKTIVLFSQDIEIRKTDYTFKKEEYSRVFFYTQLKKKEFTNENWTRTPF